MFAPIYASLKTFALVTAATLSISTACEGAVRQLYFAESATLDEAVLGVNRLLSELNPEEPNPKIDLSELLGALVSYIENLTVDAQDAEPLEKGLRG